MIALKRFPVLLALCSGVFAQTGVDVPEMRVFDNYMQAIMHKWDVQGGSLAITFNGRLVLARGYGLANVDTGELVQPDSLFRIASVSKSFTAVAALQLVEQGRLDLDAKVFDILRDLLPAKGQLVDPRIRNITVRQLLQHSAGYPDHEGLGPEETLMLQVNAADYFDAPRPASPRLMIRWALSNFPLVADPGTQYLYSNYGYSVLGRVIEEVTGQRYATVVKDHVLTPAGITRMQIGTDFADSPAAGEVHYYDPPGAPLVPNIFGTNPELVPLPYDMSHPLMDSFGGWIASAIDLSRFALAVDGYRGTALLQPDTIQMMLARPDYFPEGATNWYGFGFDVYSTPNGLQFGHNGELAGTRAWLIRTPNLTIAVLYNNASADPNGLLTDTVTAINNSFSRMGNFPSHDLFPLYDPPPPDGLKAPAHSQMSLARSTR